MLCTRFIGRSLGVTAFAARIGDETQVVVEVRPTSTWASAASDWMRGQWDSQSNAYINRGWPMDNVDPWRSCSISLTADPGPAAAFEVRYCGSCGEQRGTGFAFCGNCGARFPVSPNPEGLITDLREIGTHPDESGLLLAQTLQTYSDQALLTHDAQTALQAFLREDFASLLFHTFSMVTLPQRMVTSLSRMLSASVPH